MAWRIAENIVQGEIDNRLPGIIKGTLYLEGLKDPVHLHLEGNADPDLAGRLLTLRNLRPARRTENLDGFSRRQLGEAGTMTARHMVCLPTIGEEELKRCLAENRIIPTRWSEAVSLEWFSANGRVLVESASFACERSPAAWTWSDHEFRWARRLDERRSWMWPFDEGEDVPDQEAAEGNPCPCADLPDGRPSLPVRAETAAASAMEPMPHPLVRRMSEFLLELIQGSQARRSFVEAASENAPLEFMMESASRAHLRLAQALGSNARPGSDPLSTGALEHLREARWLLGEAAENAALAIHLISADPAWLRDRRESFRQLRNEIRSLIHEHTGSRHGSASSGPAQTITSSEGDTRHE